MDLSRPFCPYPHKNGPIPKWMDTPKSIKADRFDNSRFWINIQNPNGNSPLLVCEYHYWVACKMVNGNIERTPMWGPKIWTPWGTSFLVEH